jgi:[acyl-carrier-protein] S-malonyltransferase
LCSATLGALQVSAIIELPPAGTLVGLAKRELPGVTLLAIKSPDDLAAAQELLDGADTRPPVAEAAAGGQG